MCLTAWPIQASFRRSSLSNAHLNLCYGLDFAIGFIVILPSPFKIFSIMESVVPQEVTAELTQILSNLVLGDNQIRSKYRILISLLSTDLRESFRFADYDLHSAEKAVNEHQCIINIAHGLLNLIRWRWFNRTYFQSTYNIIRCDSSYQRNNTNNYVTDHERISQVELCVPSIPEPFMILDANQTLVDERKLCRTSLFVNSKFMSLLANTLECYKQIGTV